MRSPPARYSVTKTELRGDSKRPTSSTTNADWIKERRTSASRRTFLFSCWFFMVHCHHDDIDDGDEVMMMLTLKMMMMVMMTCRRYFAAAQSPVSRSLIVFIVVINVISVINVINVTNVISVIIFIIVINQSSSPKILALHPDGVASFPMKNKMSTKISIALQRRLI